MACWAAVREIFPEQTMLLSLSLELVLRVGERGGVGIVRRFDPQVGRVVRVAAQLERDQVVVLGDVERPGVAVGGGRGLLLRLGDALRGTDGRGEPAGTDSGADVGLGDLRIDGARRAVGIGERVGTDVDVVARPWERAAAGRCTWPGRPGRSGCRWSGRERWSGEVAELGPSWWSVPRSVTEQPWWSRSRESSAW